MARTLVIPGQYILDIGPSMGPPRGSGGSISHALAQEAQGVAQSDFYAVTEPMLAAAQPHALGRYLLDVATVTHPDTVREFNDRSGVRTVAFSQAEVVGVPQTLARLAQSASAVDGADKSGGRDLVKPYEQRIVSTAKHLEKIKTVLDERSLRLARFVVATKSENLGRSLFGGVEKTNEAFAWLWTYVLDDMLSAYSSQRDMNRDQQRNLRQSVRYTTTLHPERVSNFQSLIHLASTYNVSKSAAVSQRLDTLQRIQRKKLISG